MLRKIATASVLAAGLLVMGGAAYADDTAITSDNIAAQKWSVAHGSCYMSDKTTRVCTNFQ